MTNKVCSKCKIEKPVSDFSVDVSKKSGLRSACKKCQSNYIRFYHINRRYSITEKEYREILKSQNGTCALCSSSVSTRFSRSKHLVVDHCHKTNIVRGILCSSCNLILGVIEKKGESFLSKTQAYLNNSFEKESERKGNKLLST